jgi:Restriction endonuclease
MAETLLCRSGNDRDEIGMSRTELSIERRLNRRQITCALVCAAAAALFAGAAHALPVLEVNDRWLHEAPFRQVALWVGSILSLIAALGAIVAHRWRINVLGHNDLQSIRWLSAREFNRLVEEGFRRQGYLVQPSERNVSRGGIDLILQKAGKHVLVLCRRDSEPARQMAALQELFAATEALQDASGLLITSEHVAPAAKKFATEQGIALIEGPALLKLVQRARGEKTDPKVRREPHFGTPLNHIPVCSKCGGPMVPGADHEHLDPEQRSWYCSRGVDCRAPRLAA